MILLLLYSVIVSNLCTTFVGITLPEMYTMTLGVPIALQLKNYVFNGSYHEPYVIVSYLIL